MLKALFLILQCIVVAITARNLLKANDLFIGDDQFEIEHFQSSDSDLPPDLLSVDSSDSLSQEQYQLQLFVKSPDQPVICVEVPSSALVIDLKAAMISQGIHVGRLTFGGEVMADHCPLGDVGLSAEATIQNEYDPISFTARLHGQNGAQRIECDGIMDENLTNAEIVDKLRQCIHGAFEQFDPEDEENSYMQIKAIFTEDGSKVVVEAYECACSMDYTRPECSAPSVDTLIGRDIDGRFQGCWKLYDVPADMFRSLFSGSLTKHDFSRFTPAWVARESE